MIWVCLLQLNEQSGILFLMTQKNWTIRCSNKKSQWKNQTTLIIYLASMLPPGIEGTSGIMLPHQNISSKAFDSSTEDILFLHSNPFICITMFELVASTLPIKLWFMKLLMIVWKCTWGERVGKIVIGQSLPNLQEYFML